MYVDTDVLHVPITGQIAPVVWGAQVRDNGEFLARRPACSVFNSVTQVMSGTNIVTLAADSESYDTDAMHSTVTNNSRITAQTTGRYLALASVEYSGSFATADFHRVRTDFLLDGTTGHTVDNRRLIGSPAVSRVSIVKTFDLMVGDFVEVRAVKVSSSDLSAQLLEFVLHLLTR